MAIPAELADFQAIAADLQRRVQALESGGDSIAVPNVYFISKTGKTTTPEKIEGAGLLGLLQRSSPPKIAAGERCSGIAVSPDGLNVYAVNEQANTVSMYSRDIETGALTALGTVVCGKESRYLVISPDGQNVYTSGFNKGEIFVFGRNPVTGLLTKVESFFTPGGKAQGICISPDGENVYIVDSGKIAQYARTTSGKLVLLEREGAADRQVAISPDGENVYSTNQTTEKVGVFKRQEDGTLILLESLAAGELAFGVICSPDGRNVYVQCISGAEKMLQYARSEETGKLTPLEPASLVGGAGGFIASMAFNVTGTTLYSSSEGGINQFSRDVRTGPLRVWPFTLVSNSPAPHGFACSPDGANVYVANWETNAVDIYSLD